MSLDYRWTSPELCLGQLGFSWGTCGLWLNYAQTMLGLAWIVLGLSLGSIVLGFSLDEPWIMLCACWNMIGLTLDHAQIKLGLSWVTLGLCWD